MQTASELQLLVIGCFAGLGLKAWFENDDSCLQSCDTPPQHYTETCPAAALVQHSSQSLGEEEPYPQHSTLVRRGEDDLNQCRYYDTQHASCATSIEEEEDFYM